MDHRSPRRACVAALLLGVVAIACDGEETSPSDPAWGQVQGGLRTRLVLEADRVALGSPLPVRLEIENVGKEAREIEPQQVAVNASLEVVGPDGRPIPYVDASYQTEGPSKRIAPGETSTLARGIDVSHQYLVVRAGRHRIRFRGQGGAFGGTPIPASGVLAVDVADGALPWNRRLLVALERVRPEGWTVSEYAYGGKVQPRWRVEAQGTSFTVMRPASLKRDVVSVTIHVTQGPAAPQPGAEAKVELATSWGQFPCGHVYAEASEGMDRAWPSCREDLTRALGEVR